MKEDIPNRTTVVLSRGQSRAPKKRELEHAVGELAGAIQGVFFASIPHLYDLSQEGETVEQLRNIEGDILFLSWVYPRAAHWVLDRLGIQGQFGAVELKGGDKDEDDSPDRADIDDNPLTKGTAKNSRPWNRTIYQLDLRWHPAAEPYVEEIERILGSSHSVLQNIDPPHEPAIKLEEPTGRRWYPVIDFDRCTNCMECIDFCLFGVYGIDVQETILVEQPDNCRKGCPACSRVCPANAIIFPQHKAPAIAGSDDDSSGTGLKIDLSQLFGAPQNNSDPLETAARERDEQLLLAGRAAVGMEIGIPKRQEGIKNRPQDELDTLLDELDALDL